MAFRTMILSIFYLKFAFPKLILLIILMFGFWRAFGYGRRATDYYCFLDFINAFNSTNSDILLEILRSHNIGSLDWFESYLIGRSHGGIVSLSLLFLYQHSAVISSKFIIMLMISSFIVTVVLRM